MAEGYGNKWFTPKNILIYVIVGVIIYGAVYFLFLSNKGNSPQAPETSQTTENSLTVNLGAQNDSGQSGTATLTESDGKTTVSLSLDTGSDVPQPAHIHSGACPTPGDVVYPLENVVNGASETVLDVDLAEIQSQLPLAINVHESETNSSVYTSCGDLLENSESSPAPSSSGSMY